MFFAFALSLDLIIFDQISKYLVLRFWPEISTINPNVAFSIPISNAVSLLLTPLLLIIFIIFFLHAAKLDSRWAIAAFGFIVGGGLSNFLDRIVRGGVVDFIDLGFWPSFNLADSLITIGVLALLIFHDKILTKHG